MNKDILVNLNYEVMAEGRSDHEVVEIIRFIRHAKVIMCSAMGQQKLVVDSIHAGAI
ncbi:hypothetical protein [Paenibacillus andongensis]|uniref:hypothetical protein n=1 Tax=Paenibacillus andongensis TaxID=2975482 RepID=UPI0021BAD2CA|nr:hypothetical protein [Paenibacillus andongensis]